MSAPATGNAPGTSHSEPHVTANREDLVKLFVDTANLADIETIAGWGVLLRRHHEPHPALPGRG